MTPQLSALQSEPVDEETKARLATVPRRVPEGMDGILTIKFKRRGAEDTGYIGAYSLYAVQEGETWERGNDLPDGRYSEETIENIVTAIRAVLRGERS